MWPSSIVVNVLKDVQNIHFSDQFPPHPPAMFTAINFLRDKTNVANISIQSSSNYTPVNVCSRYAFSRLKVIKYQCFGNLWNEDLWECALVRLWEQHMNLDKTCICSSKVVVVFCVINIKKGIMGLAILVTSGGIRGMSYGVGVTLPVSHQCLISDTPAKLGIVGLVVWGGSSSAPPMGHTSSILVLYHQALSQYKQGWCVMVAPPQLGHQLLTWGYSD